MIKKKIAIIGAGGFGRELFYLLDREIYECVGFIDVRLPKEQLPAPIIGSESDIEQIQEKHIISFFAIAIGNIYKRITIIDSLKKYSLTFPSITHPSAQIFSNNFVHNYF